MTPTAAPTAPVDPVAAHLARHHIRGWEVLGFDPACLAAIDVPEAARLAGLAGWARLAVGVSGVAGACLAWMSALPWAAPVAAVGVGLFVWNLLRLGMAGGAPTHRGEAAVAAWRPGRGAVVLLGILGALLAQPMVALVAGVVHPTGLAERRATLVARWEAAVAQPYDDELAALDGDMARVTGGLRADLEARRRAVVAARATDLAEQGPRIAARIAASPMFATGVALGWAGPVGPVLTAVLALLVAAPAVARRAAPGALGQYERVRVRRERAAIERAWHRSEARLVQLLAPWRTFPGQLRAVSTDPPFDDRPLLLGFAAGTVGPPDLAALRAFVPGYDAACTPGGRARAAERRRLDAAIAAAAATPGAADPLHLAALHLARAEGAEPVDPDAARVDATLARAALDAAGPGARSPVGHVGAVRAALLLDDLPAAQAALSSLLDAGPAEPEARRLALSAHERDPGATPDERLRRARALLARCAGTEEEARAGRAVARALLPRGGPEATRLADEGLRAAKSAGDPRGIAAALDLVAALDLTRAPASRREAARLLERVWSDDPTPANTLDLACLVYAAARRWTDPHAAKLEMARARALAEEAHARRPGPRTEAVLAAMDAHRAPPLIEG